MKPKVSVRVICITAMLIALAFVFERLLPVINLPSLRITLAFVPMMCCGMLFGPLWGALAYGVSDILGWPLMGLPPIPLILASRIAEGFLYGLILHRKELKFMPFALMCAFLTQSICGAGLTTLGLSLFFGMPYLPLLVSRLIQLAVMSALQLAVFPLLLKIRETLQKSGIIAIEKEL